MSVGPRLLSKIFLGRENPERITTDVIISPDHVRFISTVLSESRKKARAEAAAMVAAASKQRGTPERAQPSEAMVRELDDLRREVANLEEKLKDQQDHYEGQLATVKVKAAESEKHARKESERALRSYMKASIHALHRLQKND